MKSRLTILPVIILLTLSCSSIKQISSNNEITNSLKAKEITDAVESNQYIIKANSMTERRGRTVDIRPSHNYIIIDEEVARINVAYTGRSYDIRGISGINMTGKVIEKEINQKRNGGYKIKLRIRQNTDLFTVNISAGKDGYCSFNISHPRIELSRYRGNMYRIN